MSENRPDVDLHTIERDDTVIATAMKWSLAVIASLTVA